MESSKNPTLISKAWPSDDDDKIYVQWTATNCKFAEFEPTLTNIC